MVQSLPCPSEGAEQAALMRWAMYQQGKWPEMDMLYHVPNEGKRSRVTGGQMKQQGMKKGVPDLCLPVPRGAWHGLYIEMKKRQDATPTQDQADWLDKLHGQGYCVCWCRGWEEAAQAITDYMKKGAIQYSPTRGRGGRWHAREVTGTWE